MTATVIAIANTKGGVGKTTTALHIGTELRARAFRVAMGDADPQTPGLTITLMTDSERNRLVRQNSSMYRLLDVPELGVEGAKLPIAFSLKSTITVNGKRELRYKQAEDILQCAPMRGWKLNAAKDDFADGTFDLIPGMLSLAWIARSLDTKARAGTLERENVNGRLRMALEVDAIDEYDYIILDTPPAPPADSLVMMNVLMAADVVIMPTTLARTSVFGCIADLQIVDEINQKFRSHRPAKVLGVAIQKSKDIELYDAIAHELYDNENATLRNLMFHTRVPDEDIVEVAAYHLAPVQFYAPMSYAAVAFNQLTREVLERLGTH